MTRLFRVRLWNDTECDVIHVALADVDAPQHFALVMLDDGKLETVSLYGAVAVAPKAPKYERPAPTSLPGPGEVRE